MFHGSWNPLKSSYTNQQKEVIAMKKLLEVLMTYFLTICVGMLLFAFLAVSLFKGTCIGALFF